MRATSAARPMSPRPSTTWRWPTSTSRSASTRRGPRVRLARRRLSLPPGVPAGDRRLQRGHPARSRTSPSPISSAASPITRSRSRTRPMSTTPSRSELDPKYITVVPQPRHHPLHPPRRLRGGDQRLHQGAAARARQHQRADASRRGLRRQAASSTRASPTSTGRSSCRRNSRKAFYYRGILLQHARQHRPCARRLRRTRSGSSRGAPRPTSAAPRSMRSSTTTTGRSPTSTRRSSSSRTRPTSVLQPRLLVFRQGRVRQGHRRLQRGDQAQSAAWPWPTTTAA